MNYPFNIHVFTSKSVLRKVTFKSNASVTINVMSNVIFAYLCG